MRIRPAWALAALAAASWTATFAVDALNLCYHCWVYSLTGSGIATLAAVFVPPAIKRNHDIGVLTRKIAVLTRVTATRPFYEDPTGPHPVLPLHVAPAASGQPQPARRATR